METRANYVVIGLFTLAVVVGVFGFIFWFQNLGGSGERAYYRVLFAGSVSGLRTGGTVLFNGIRVGEVTGLALDPQKPEQVVATIAVDKSVAIRPDTQIAMEFQGLTGIASLSLKGGNPNSPALVGTKDNPPVLVAPPGATADVTSAARDVLAKLNDFISQNQATFKSAMDNINKFTAALANNSEHIDSTLASIDKFAGSLSRNSDKIDQITSGLQNLTGGADGKGGQINEAARSIKTLADHLDQRTAEITTSVTRLTSAGTRQLDTLSGNAQRTLDTINRAVENLDRNPSRLIWGGSGSNLPDYNGKR
ncbi:MAG TPA: MlaD family protein [Pseudolabrys sp.]|jgi:phospholipid/cholesterol/gamma-HCH transport system substrate-binding protein